MSTKNYFLTPGPSELYFTVPDHIQTAIKNGIGSISHRSKAFTDIFGETVQNLRDLLNIPDNFHVVFTGSATEIWQHQINNCTSKKTFHLVNGSFSTRFYEFSKSLGREAVKHEVPFGKGFNVDELDVPADTEMLCVTQNETSSGVQLPVEDIYKLREKYPEILIAVDAVSAVPYVDIDFSKIDSLFFSVQKGIGLPAGLGIWVFNEKCVAKNKALIEAGQVINPYHSISTLLKNAEKNMTQATPNVLGIYLLGKVAEDMLRRGIETIRQETEFKSALMYNMLEKHDKFKPFVEIEAHRSQTVVVADILDGTSSSEVIASLKEHGLEIGKGYGKLKDSQIRIANFPTSSKEIFFQLSQLMEKM